MRFATREDIAAPIEVVFGAVSDFNGFERAAMRRGADVVRLDEMKSPGKGMIWLAQFSFRNRQRNAKLRLVEYDPSNGLELYTRSSGIEASLLIDLVALSRNRTRMNLSLDLKPKTIPGRLMVQSLRMAKANLNKRFRMRVANFAEGVEERYDKPAV